MSNGDDSVLVRPVSAREDVETLSSQDRSLLARWLADSAECEDVVVSRLRRRVGLVVTVGGVVLLVPWVSELATTLPDHHSAHQWRIAWTGFDVALTLAFALTAIAGWRRRQITISALTVSGCRTSRSARQR